jgi:hypothetical protein
LTGYWEATFRGTGASTTEWTVTAANTLCGAFPKAAEAAVAAIEQCGNEATSANPPIAAR